MKAWHFTHGKKLRDGSAVPEVGETLKYKDGGHRLHSSESIFDAMKYAPGSTIHRVKLGADILKPQEDILAATERTILWSVDAEELLKAFARKCALHVIHLWNPTRNILNFLETGDEEVGKKGFKEILGLESLSPRYAAWSAFSAALDKWHPNVVPLSAGGAAYHSTQAAIQADKELKLGWLMTSLKENR